MTRVSRQLCTKSYDDWEGDEKERKKSDEENEKMKKKTWKCAGDAWRRTARA